MAAAVIPHSMYAASSTMPMPSSELAILPPRSPGRMAIGQGNAVTVHAAGYNEANKASYTAAFAAIIPEALHLVTEAKTRAERPRH